MCGWQELASKFRCQPCGGIQGPGPRKRHKLSPPKCHYLVREKRSAISSIIVPLDRYCGCRRTTSKHMLHQILSAREVFKIKLSNTFLHGGWQSTHSLFVTPETCKRHSRCTRQALQVRPSGEGTPTVHKNTLFSREVKWSFLLQEGETAIFACQIRNLEHSARRLWV